jgi:hypothetical protein
MLLVLLALLSGLLREMKVRVAVFLGWAVLYDLNVDSSLRASLPLS